MWYLLTVKHIVMKCVDFNDVRNKHFVVCSIKDLFENVKALNIIDFVINYFHYLINRINHEWAPLNSLFVLMCR